MNTGSGNIVSKSTEKLLKNIFGISIPGLIDLNAAPESVIKKHPFVTKTLASKIISLRKRKKIETITDLFPKEGSDLKQFRIIEQLSYGKTRIRPFLTGLTIINKQIYVDEPFSIRVNFIPQSLVKPEILSIAVRFPSGQTGVAHFNITEKNQQDGFILLDKFISKESGEFNILATLRDESGKINQMTTSAGVFTRNPVRMYITPSYWTQSGTVGAPKYNFSEKRWYCYASVRWVNSTSREVNLGKRITVKMTDGGTHIGTFSFDLSSNIIIPPQSTIYGNLHTRHGESSNAYDVFINKGDLTYEYSMSGSGFTPVSRQIWRTMRVIGYNIIRVGDFTSTERSEYRRAAADIASGIFQSRDMTVHEVKLYRIEGTTEMDADKARFRFIDSQDEINDLRDKYTVDNWYLDVFFVEGRYDGSFGSSPVDGPEDKEGDSSGLVIRRDSDTTNLGQTFAHEGGHYLGLEHADEDDGCDDTDPGSSSIDDNFIFSSSRRDSDVITGCQINKMRQHGLVRALTP